MNWLIVWSLIEWLIRLTMVVVILRRQFMPATSLAWLTITFLLPELGLFLYLLLGDARMGRKRTRLHRLIVFASRRAGRLSRLNRHIIRPDVAPELEPVILLAENIGGMPILGGNDVELLSEAEDLIARLIADIDAAEHHVHLLYYIYACDEMGNKLSTALMRAAKRGIDPVAFRLELLKDSPRGRRVVEEVAKMADWGRERPGRGLGFAYINYSGTQLAAVAEVSVERASGKIRVHNFWTTIDTGVAVQPDNVVAQTEGSIVYGIGLALSERITIEDGAVKESNFYDYQVPRMSDIPEIHIKLIVTDNHPTGAGQMATPLVAPVIANAVHQLTGARLRQQPLLPDQVRQAMLETGVTLQDLVTGLNRLGMQPRDIITILQAIKAAGALQAEIEVM